MMNLKNELLLLKEADKSFTVMMTTRGFDSIQSAGHLEYELQGACTELLRFNRQAFKGITTQSEVRTASEDNGSFAVIFSKRGLTEELANEMKTLASYEFESLA